MLLKQTKETQHISFDGIALASYTHYHATKVRNYKSVITVKIQYQALKKVLKDYIILWIP